VNDDFYIGYEPQMPDGLAPRIRVVAATLVSAAIVLACGLTAAQGRFNHGIFEFGHERQLRGRLIERPYPLLVADDGARYFLVGPGKRGAAAIAAGFDGRLVQVRGARIERDGTRMLQVSSGGIQEVRGAAIVPPARLEAIGTRTLEGEIVDSKCHLGVMKPGEGPLHRDCAVRCLLGGAPPMLATDSGGLIGRIVLIAADGGPLVADLEPWTARPLRARGRLFRRGDEQYLAIEPGGLDIR
jgi:hypothetical protein